MFNCDIMKIKENVKIAAFTVFMLGAAMPVAIYSINAITEYIEPTDVMGSKYDDSDFFEFRNKRIPDYGNMDKRPIEV